MVYNKYNVKCSDSYSAKQYIVKSIDLVTCITDYTYDITINANTKSSSRHFELKTLQSPHLHSRRELAAGTAPDLPTYRWIKKIHGSH